MFKLVGSYFGVSDGGDAGFPVMLSWLDRRPMSCSLRILFACVSACLNIFLTSEYRCAPPKYVCVRRPPMSRTRSSSPSFHDFLWGRAGDLHRIVAILVQSLLQPPGCLRPKNQSSERIHRIQALALPSHSNSRGHREPAKISLIELPSGHGPDETR